MKRPGASIFVGIVLALATDLASKSWAEHLLSPQQSVNALGSTLRFTLGGNSGVAFGLLAGTGLLPIVVTGVIITALLTWAIGYRADRFPTANLLIGLVVGGALGNFFDRLTDGRVTDFLDLGVGALRWPTFNLADSFILGGLALLLLVSRRRRHGVPRTVEESR